MDDVKNNRMTAGWVITVMLLFILAITFGIILRLNQGTNIKLQDTTFYTLMTTHGVTMVGIWFVAAMAGVHHLLRRYVNVSVKLSVIAFVMTVIGVLMLWSTTFIGGYHTGWTFLYPLPLYKGWANWASPVFLLGLAVLGLAWFIWSLGLMWAILKKYPLWQAMAWQMFGKNESKAETPPFILITTVSLIAVIACLLTAVVLLILYFAEILTGGTFKNDALLMKNLTFFFGHTLMNETLYLGVATLYELLPAAMGRPKFKTTWYVGAAWNATMLIVLFAFFHHLYMDFVQPVTVQMIGQIASYMATLPSAAVTFFSVIMLIYRNPVKWSVVSTLYFLGIIGWAVGGIGAVIDATITNNLVLHNTLWVPAHFHTYNAMGNVLFSLAFFYWVAQEIAKVTDTEKSSKLFSWALVIGGSGFLIAFYLAGAQSIPRRYSVYPAELSSGAMLATVGAAFATLYLVAIIMIKVTIARRCLKAFTSPS